MSVPAQSKSSSSDLSFLGEDGSLFDEGFLDAAAAKVGKALKEDPEFRFRRKPTKKKEVMRGNEAVFEKPKKIATDTQKELERRKAEKYMFKPQDENIQTWDMIGLVMITYTAFVTPYDVAFLEPDINVLFFFNRRV